MVGTLLSGVAWYIPGLAAAWAVVWAENDQTWRVYRSLYHPISRINLLWAFFFGLFGPVMVFAALVAVPLFFLSGRNLDPKGWWNRPITRGRK